MFDACVLSRLSYVLSAAFVNKAALRRVGGFQAQCLRKILGVAHSYYSRVSNAEILDRAGLTKISSRIRGQQMILMGRVAGSTVLLY